MLSTARRLRATHIRENGRERGLLLAIEPDRAFSHCYRRLEGASYGGVTIVAVPNLAEMLEPEREEDPLRFDPDNALTRNDVRSEERARANRRPLAHWLEKDDRYTAIDVLGEGGMGRVELCKDTRIGREIARKVLHIAHGWRSDTRARFEREAQVQGQLEHPAIVPVYDLASGADGALFFTMRRVRGHTLAHILDRLLVGDTTFQKTCSRRKLLTAFSNVCLAVAFAHSRGVLHRDLKPENVMLGDFGEVYVLDWGLAKVMGSFEETLDLPSSSNGRSSNTSVGAVMGTAGYMAPEQALGRHDKIDARTDVYALGAILFELLTLRPLCPRRSSEEILSNTLVGVDARASIRYPDADVPLELEEICVRATALNPDDRFGSTREMHDAIERYLDGDRDLERRRQLAAVHAGRAAAAARAARAGTASDVQEAREEAIREVSRALALDPEHRGATRTILSLLLEMPKEVPAEAEAELEASLSRNQRASARAGVYAYAFWFLAALLMLLLGVRNWVAMATTTALLLCSALFTRWLDRTGRVDRRTGFVALFLSSACISSLSMLFGPFVFVTGLAAANTAVYAMLAKRGAQRYGIILVGLSAVILPLLLEVFGVLPPSMDLREGAITLLPRMVEFHPTQTMFFLVLVSVMHILIPVFLITRIGDAAVDAERRVFLHAYHLRQFLPDEARAMARISPEEPTENALTPSFDGAKSSIIVGAATP